MSSAEILDSPDITPRDDRIAEWEAEREAFRQLLPSLLSTHRGQFVAIYQARVVEAGEDEIQVARRAYARHGCVPLFVELVTDQPRRTVRLPSPRVVRSVPQPEAAALD
jgi:hypothetical protein